MARLRAMAKIGARAAAEGWLFKHILIPTDGSDLSRKAVLYGVQLAKASGARVTGLTIAEPYRVASMDAVLVSIGEDEYDGESRRISDRALEQVKMAAEAAGVACETVREVHDQPYRAIIDFSARAQLRPDRHGFARSARALGPLARQRDRQGADPLDRFRCWSTAEPRARAWPP